MKPFLIGLGILIAVIAAAAYYILFTGPPLHKPSDLSDFLGSPESPILVSDISDIAAETKVERDVRIELRDGVHLSANVFRPIAEGRYPVVLAFTAYHKDETPTQYPDYLRKNATPEYDSGTIRVNEWTPWEAPDPAYWVSQGYAVIIVDSRGYGLSEGTAGVLSLQDRDDFHDAIAWAGIQDWSNGNVGLTGVSYLAIAQWIAGADAPSHLKAIMPWEGQSDNYREVLFHGGIPETAFTNFWLTRVRSKANKTSLPPHRIMRFAGSRPMLMKRVSARAAPSGISLPDITVPALICASWSDHGMHTRGSFEGYKQISSTQKW
ncbi:MAG: CocE/NonD family hydrolase, partial [Pseudomonadota bacterium]